MTIFSCDCGRKTTEPYLIKGMMYCVICAEDIAPGLVSQRAAYNWKAYTRENRRVPTSQIRLDKPENKPSGSRW